ncbi:activator of basal transcription 1 [Lingula anatina]|uniref:Activator of basal transcription 1 n=1 Tax=Lingula anatina TaxID=7574 RepID=A0A1S3IVA3_LINAN|nr:activator of basal transcription 1 [Lingula anatina]|eukprot:XP_013402130.1 activator of basal transcription 1 [Lingula anatina]
MDDTCDDPELLLNEQVDEQVENKLKLAKLEKKEREAGIIYFSRIPPYMSVKKVRQIFEQFGEIGRIFLQPDQRTPKGKKARLFTEGWLEFADKRIAKRVALSLNNTQIGGKRRSRWHDEIWNIKYLPKFKWVHLNERLAYEKEVHKQRMRTEIAQVKKEANFYVQNVEKGDKFKRLEKAQKMKGQVRKWEFTQKDTEDEILSKKSKLETSEGQLKGPVALRQKKKERKLKGDPKKKAGLNKSFLASIFSGGGMSDT